MYSPKQNRENAFKIYPALAEKGTAQRCMLYTGGMLVNAQILLYAS